MKHQTSFNSFSLNGEKLGFIVGHFKSGSTWLINLLSLHPKIVGIAETNIFHHAFKYGDFKKSNEVLFKKTAWGEEGLKKLPKHYLAKLVNNFRKYRKPVLRLNPLDRPTTFYNLSLLNQFRLRNLLLKSETPEDYCRRFFSFLMLIFSPEKYLIEKCPANIFNVPRIKDVFPNCKLMSVHRDGRDVVISHYFFWKNEKREQEWSFGNSVLLWKKAIEAELEFADKYGIWVCSYEDLLSNGRGIVKDILNFLKLDSDKAIVNSMIEKSSFKFITGRTSGVENRKEFYRKGTSGDWRNHFTDEDKKTFKRLAGNLLIRLGYESDYNW